MVNEYFVRVGNKLAAVRKKLSLTKSEMAHNVNLSTAQYVKLEMGYAFPNEEILHILSSKYHISLDWLAADIGKMIDDKEETRTTKPDFGTDQESVDELVITMYQVPVVKNAMLSYFFEYIVRNRKIIEKTMAGNQQKSTKINL